MKKCPYCGAEYPDDAVKCTIDHTPFERPAEAPRPGVKELSPETGGPKYSFPSLSALDMQKDLVTLVKCGTLAEADLIVSRLEVAGIKTFVPDESVVIMAGNPNTFGYIRVQVAPKDYDPAKELLSDIYGAS